LLVVDASVVVKACLSEAAFSALPAEPLVAPPLLWSEVSSVLHELRWRATVQTDLARIAVERLDDAPIQRQAPPELLHEAWRVADELGWAKTYDAEYVALARILNLRLVTLDVRLRRSAGRLVRVIGPTEI
jgi:predicted nucleic acid-binding protein